MTICAKWFFKWFTARNVVGMALFPIILIRDKALLSDEILIRHERIHLRQQLELLIIPFYIWYVVEFAIRFIQFGSAQKAYMNISFEREAFSNERNQHYLNSRKFWKFIHYL